MNVVLISSYLEWPCQDVSKATNLKTAIYAYAKAAGKTNWRPADLTNYTMGWCDCRPVKMQACSPQYGCYATCDQDGYVMNGVGIIKLAHADGYEIVPNDYSNNLQPITCCRPCFKA